MYVSFQVLSIINDYWLIHRIPVSFSGASTYNKLSRIMMLCCCTHNSLVQCNHSYMIPEYDALYDLKRQWYYEFLPFLSSQPGIDKLILWGDVARRYVHQLFGLEKHAFDRGSWFRFHNNVQQHAPSCHIIQVMPFDASNKPLIQNPSNPKVYLKLTYICYLDVIHFRRICIYWWCVLHIWTMSTLYLEKCCISGRWMLHIWTVTYLHVTRPNRFIFVV